MGQLTTDAEHNKALRKELDTLKIEHEKVLTSYKSLEAVYNDLKVKNEETMAKIEKTHCEALERVKEQDQLKLNKTILELEKQHQEQIKQLNEQYQTKLMEIWDNKKKQKQNTKQDNKATDTTPIQQILGQDN